MKTKKVSKLKKYVLLQKKYKRAIDECEQNSLIEKMEELYYLLDEDEIAFLESRGLC